MNRNRINLDKSQTYIFSSQSMMMIFLYMFTMMMSFVFCSEALHAQSAWGYNNNRVAVSLMETVSLMTNTNGPQAIRMIGVHWLPHVPLWRNFNFKINWYIALIIIS